MSLDLSALTAYTEENRQDLIKASILEGRTMSMITVQPGITSSETINILDTTSTLQSGGNCGWTANGSTTISQRVISVCDITEMEGICVDKLEKFYTQKMMEAGSYNHDSIPFEGMYVDLKAKKIANAIEELLWVGDTSTSGNAGLCDGFIKLFKNNSDVIDVTSLDFTAPGIVTSVESMVAATPTDILGREDVKIFMGYDKFQVWTAALRTTNNFHFTGADTNDFKQYVPGTNVEVVAVSGLNNKANIVLTYAENMVAGTSLMSDFEAFELFYFQADDEVRFRFKGKIGFQVAFPQFVVLGA